MTNETDMPEEEEIEEFTLSSAEVMELAELEASMKAEESLKTEEKEESGMSYADIYASVLLNGEIIITIPSYLTEKIKMGLRNHKARQLAKLRAIDQVADDTILTFSTEEPLTNTEIEIVNLTITLRERTVVPVLKLTIPDGDF